MTGDASTSGTVRVGALGDLMLAGDWEAVARGCGGWSAVASDLRDALCDHVVFANLETTLESGDGLVPKEPRVVASADTVRSALAALGVEVVSLANNHAFDGRLAGFEAVRTLLDEIGVASFGAGRDVAEAARPCVTERNGVRLGWLGWVAADTNPSHVAGVGSPGVNPLMPGRALEAVRALKREVHHVAVSLHWGVEYCHVPAREQVDLARALIDAGASLVLGHHAHVIQGVESYGAGIIAYGLGNATTTDLEIGGRLAIKQSRRTRSAIVLRAVLDAARVRSFDVVPIRSSPVGIVVGDPHARRVAARADRNVLAGRSAGRWRARRFVEDVVLRTLWKLDPRVIRSLRRDHVSKLWRNLAGAGPA